MKKYSLFYIFVMLVMTACEKEIDLDYRSVDAIYVAEGCMTQEKTTVRLTTTQDMTDNQTNAHNVEGAVVVISDEDMVLDTLHYTGRGVYTSFISTCC